MANLVFDMYDRNLFSSSVFYDEVCTIYYYRLLNAMSGLPREALYKNEELLYPSKIYCEQGFIDLSFEKWLQKVGIERLCFNFFMWLRLAGIIRNSKISSTRWDKAWKFRSFFIDSPFVIGVQYNINSYSTTAGVYELVFTVNEISILTTEDIIVINQDIIIKNYDTKYTFPRLAKVQSGKLFSTKYSNATVMAEIPSGNRIIGLIDFLKGTKCDDGYVLALPCFGEQI